MDRILELTINELIKRMEVLEKEVTELKRNNSNYNIEASKTDNASNRQIKFLKDLGIEPNKEITKFEAKTLIEEALKRRDLNIKKPISSEGDKKPLKETENKDIPMEMNESNLFNKDGVYL